MARFLGILLFSMAVITMCLAQADVEDLSAAETAHRGGYGGGYGGYGGGYGGYGGGYGGYGGGYGGYGGGGYGGYGGYGHHGHYRG